MTRAFQIGHSGAYAISAMTRILYLVAFSVLLLSGCATLQPQDFAKSNTRFELDRFFTGHTRSWGVFENSHGAPSRYFTCDSYGKRDSVGDVTLNQHFHFSDGKTQRRDWHIHRVDLTHWEATANDMVGVARGKGSGNAFYWEYTLTLDRGNPLASVHIRQWMYQAEGTDKPPAPVQHAEELNNVL